MSGDAQSMAEALTALLAGRRGHFRMESGYHSERWFELDGLFTDRARLAPFARELARRLAQHRVEAVCGPETGGARLAEMIAGELGVMALRAERFETPGASGLFPVRYELPAEQRAAAKGKVVAIVDDAVSAGSAVRGTYADLITCGARPVAVGALFIFGGAAAKYAAEKGLALEGIAPLDYGMWRPEECPLCRAGVAVERVSDAGAKPKV